MRTFVSNLTAAMLLVHALVGCCRHPEHSHTSCENTEFSDSLATDCCRHDHEPSSHKDEQPFSPCDCQFKCKALCIFLPPEKTLVDARQTVLCIDVVAIASCAANGYAPSAHRYWSAESVLHGLEPPLRLHLLHQIILV